MTRIAGVPPRHAGLLARLAYRFTRRQFGMTPEPLTVAAQHPWILRGYVAYEAMLDRARLVDRRLRLLAELKVAALIGCRFCLDIGAALGRKTGVTEAQLRDLTKYPCSDAFSPLERAVLDYAVALTRTPVEVPDALFTVLREHLSEPALVELTAGIAWANYRSRFDHALGIGAQGFAGSAYCPLAERSECS
jgi:4-carboxymuconolactone decarboxylase